MDPRVEDYSSSDDSCKTHLSNERPVVSANPFNINIENLANRDGDILPFAFYEPKSKGAVTWNCGYDANGKIISIFCYKKDLERDKLVREYETLAEAIDARNVLINAGWQKLTPPRIEFTVPDEKGGSRPLNRKEKRALERMNPAKLKKLTSKK
jgi:hypothetical protein